MKQVVIAYVPVLHEGYRRFFDAHKDAETLYIFGPEVIAEFDHLAKEIRALDPALLKKAIESWNIFSHVEILDNATLITLAKEDITVAAPDEDVVKELLKKYLPDKKAEFSPIFLRWDKHNSSAGKAVEADQKISREEFDRNILAQLSETAEKKSSDWWRRIGAAIIKDGKVLFSRVNEHQPSAHTPYVNGDPRNNFHKGVHVELSTSLHAEAGLVADAAREGISLKGASMYTTTFPCPPCAKVVSHSGISKLYYTGGYGVLDGVANLKDNGIEIIYVENK